jgi:hypothetical protein
MLILISLDMLMSNMLWLSSLKIKEFFKILSKGNIVYKIFNINLQIVLNNYFYE